MCVMCVGTSAAERPTRAELTTASCNNPDGFGYGVVVDLGTTRKLFSGHSMSAETAINEYLELLETCESMENLPTTDGSENPFRVLGHLFHARIATRGGVHLGGCHPFTVGDGSGSLLAHNGILPLGIPATDPRVDSQVFAEDILPMFGGVEGLMNQYTWDVLDGFVEGAGSKVVILNTVHDESPVIILGENLGRWDKKSGLWWSNTSYQERRVYAPAAGTYGTSRMADAYDTFEQAFGDDCIACYTKLETDYGYCEWCRTCQDCGSNVDECICLVTR